MVPLIVLVALIGGGLVYYAKHDIHNDVLQDVKTKNVSALEAHAKRFTGKDKLAIDGFVVALKQSLPAEDPLKEFATALVFAGAASGAWANAYGRIGRQDIAQSMASVILASRKT